jgi:hypothetical protein
MHSADRWYGWLLESDTLTLLVLGGLRVRLAHLLSGDPSK